MRIPRINAGLALRLAIGFMVVCGSLLVLYGFWAAQAAEQALRDELGRKLGNMALLVTGEEKIRVLLYADDEGAVVASARRRLAEIARASSISNLVVVDPGGHVLADARGRYRFREEALLLQLDRTEMERVRSGKVASSRIYEGLDKSLYLSAYAPVTEGGKVVAVVGAEASADYLANVRKLRRRFSVTGLAVLALAGILGWLVAGTITRPVRLLRSAADRVARGDYGAMAQVRAGHELGELARAFNRMSLAINANHERMLEGMSDGLVAVDEDGRITTVNRSAEDMLGAKRDALLGRNFKERLPGWISEAIADALFGDIVQRDQRVQVSSPSGNRILEVNTTPLLDADGARRGVEVDFSDRTELDMLTSALEAQKRFAAIGEMAATVAHEVRNPLSAIQGFADLLRMEVGGGAKAMEYLGDLVKEVRTMERIVGSLLVYARPPRPDLAEVRPEALADATCRAMRPEFERSKVALELAPGNGSPVVRADAKMVQAVLCNLLRNALEASSEGGKVRVDVAGVTEPVPGVRISVEDRGSGLEPSIMPRLFTPFATTKARGTGLGLSIAKKYVEAHGGTIALEPLDKGVRADVFFPVEPIIDEE